jgi:hypothetical protein
MPAGITLQQPPPPPTKYDKEDILFSLQVVGAVLSVIMGLVNFRKMLIDSQAVETTTQYLSANKKAIFWIGILGTVLIVAGALYYFKSTTDEEDLTV